MTLTPFLERPYRPGVGIMLLNKNHDIFVAQRLDTPGKAWQMPQGGINFGETPQNAALRELSEETGCQPPQGKILIEHPDWLTYDLPYHLADVVWGGAFRGQAQKWFALQFLGQNNDINLTLDSGSPPEFSDWRWASPGELPNLAVTFKTALYQQLLKKLYPMALTILTKKDTS